jgi:hypothetical protein
MFGNVSTVLRGIERVVGLVLGASKEHQHHQKRGQPNMPMNDPIQRDYPSGRSALMMPPARTVNG